MSDERDACIFSRPDGSFDRAGTGVGVFGVDQRAGQRINLKPDTGVRRGPRVISGIEHEVSEGLTTQEGDNWHHSDFREVAYLYTYKLFYQFVNSGDLR